MADELDDCRDATVTVHLDLHSKDLFYFTTSDLKLDPPCHLYFNHGKKNGFKINFDLDDPDNVYSFGSDKSKALYSTEENRCPHEEVHWDGFKVHKIDNGGMRLVVHNPNTPKNGVEQDFGYTLRITKDGVNYKDLDPIGTNQNNNSANVGYSAAFVFAVGGAAISGLIAAFAMPATTQMSVLSAALIGAVVGLGAYFLTRGGMARTA